LQFTICCYYESMRGDNFPLAQEHICSSCTRRRSSSIPMHNQTISCVSQFAFLLDSWSAGAICGEKRGGMNARSDQRSLGDLQPKRVWSCTSRTCSRVSVCSVAPGSRCGDVSMGKMRPCLDDLRHSCIWETEHNPATCHLHI
jgi:hypothetical protein